MHRPQRNERIDLRVEHAERAMLVKLASREGLSASAWIRQRIRTEFRAVFGDVQPRMPKTPKTSTEGSEQ